MSLGLLCVHAHPDDESITTGGVLRLAADAGHRTAVVTCTGGELGEIVGRGMDPDEVRPRLAALRHAELTEALALLGADGPRMLGYRDSGMAGTQGNDDPRSFWRADIDEAVGRLVAHVRQFRPDVLVAYDGFGGYGHPDHVQAHRVALLAAEAAHHGLLYPQAGAPWRVRKVYQSTVPTSFVAMANAELPARGLPSPFGEETDPAKVLVGTPDALVTTTVDVRAAGPQAGGPAGARQPARAGLAVPQRAGGAGRGRVRRGVVRPPAQRRRRARPGGRPPRRAGWGLAAGRARPLAPVPSARALARPGVGAERASRVPMHPPRVSSSGGLIGPATPPGPARPG